MLNGDFEYLSSFAYISLSWSDKVIAGGAEEEGFNCGAQQKSLFQLQRLNLCVRFFFSHYMLK